MKRIILALTYLVVLLFQCPGSALGESPLLNIAVNGKGGYVDRSGRIVVEP